jgi:hypothetical protein
MEAAVAISLGPGKVATFTGAACATDHRQAGVRLVPILLSWRPVRSSKQPPCSLLGRPPWVKIGLVAR